MEGRGAPEALAAAAEHSIEPAEEGASNATVRAVEHSSATARVSIAEAMTTSESRSRVPTRSPILVPFAAERAADRGFVMAPPESGLASGEAARSTRATRRLDWRTWT